MVLKKGTNTPFSNIQKSPQRQWTRKKRIVMSYLFGTGLYTSPHIVEQFHKGFEKNTANLGSSSNHRHTQVQTRSSWTTNIHGQQSYYWFWNRKNKPFHQHLWLVSDLPTRDYLPCSSQHHRLLLLPKNIGWRCRCFWFCCWRKILLCHGVMFTAQIRPWVLGKHSEEQYKKWSQCTCKAMI